jgi:hypothetical protein
MEIRRITQKIKETKGWVLKAVEKGGWEVKW